MPNSLFASSDFAGYWKRVQKSFFDYVGFGKIGRVPDPNILFTPTSNRHPSLPISSIVFAAISSKTGFMEWHASRGG